MTDHVALVHQTDARVAAVARTVAVVTEQEQLAFGHGQRELILCRVGRFVDIGLIQHLAVDEHLAGGKVDVHGVTADCNDALDDGADGESLH